jgi:hypothetical protein
MVKPAPALFGGPEMPAQARRWLTRWAAATVHRVDQQQAEQKQDIGAA